MVWDFFTFHLILIWVFQVRYDHWNKSNASNEDIGGQNDHWPSNISVSSKILWQHLPKGSFVHFSPVSVRKSYRAAIVKHLVFPLVRIVFTLFLLSWLCSFFLFLKYANCTSLSLLVFSWLLLYLAENLWLWPDNQSIFLFTSLYNCLSECQFAGKTFLCPHLFSANFIPLCAIWKNVPVLDQLLYLKYETLNTEILFIQIKLNGCIMKW